MDTSRFGDLGESLTQFFTKKRGGPPGPPKLANVTAVAAGRLSFQIQIARGQPYQIQVSTDLKSWHEVDRGHSTTDSVEFLDPEAEKYAVRFYRVLMGENVLSTNTVGYVRMSLPPGFSMVANPFVTPNNRVAALFPIAPDGTALNKFDTTLFKLNSNNFKDGKWSNPAEVMNPGEGAIMSNPTSDYRSITLAGDLLRGDLSLPLPSGFSIRSSLLPLPGVLDADLAFPIAEGDVVHLFNREKQDYAVYSFKDGKWAPSAPLIAAGESFWCGKTSASNWVQNKLLGAGDPAPKPFQPPLPPPANPR